MEELERCGFFPSDNRVILEPLKAEEGKDALGISITRRSIRVGEMSLEDTPPGFFTQTRLQFARELVNIKRNTAAVGARFGFTAFMSILIGIIFFNVGTTDPTESLNLQSHFGALIIVLMSSMFGSAQPALLAFPDERPVFLREYSTNHYSVISYFMSRFTIEAMLSATQILLQVTITYFMIGFQARFGVFYAGVYMLAMASTAIAVMLGCAVEQPKLAQEMLPLLFVPQMLFSGFFVAPDLMPVWLRWAQYLCSLTYAVRIVLVAEFQNCGGGDDLEASMACNNLLKGVGANPDDTWWYWLVLATLFIVFRSLALVVLRAKAIKFF